MPLLTIPVSKDLLTRLTRDAKSAGEPLARYCTVKLEAPDMLPALRDLRRDLDRRLAAKGR